ncbi:unnamed protein product [Adineta steineri]|uniref:UAS domain-containing protein n=1 Tax=Adineta steineri TaxID=433720 RepID=A0A815DA57_9BILA|nr:unnamed protein product [Adineta steineri]CAF3508077.1 unnamed protein product [Adineta steineri]
MIKKQRYEMLAQFQSRTAIFNSDESIKILEQFRWNCLEAINYVLNNVNSTKEKTSNLVDNIIQPSPRIDQPLVPNECLNEIDGIRHFERVFQDRHENIHRWPIWFKSSLENAIHQSHGPFAIFLNHDGSPFTTTFSRQILCSPSILNVFMKYKCILWPWDITYPLNKQRLLERSGRAQQIFIKCFSYFDHINNYPLLILLSRQNDRIVLLDIVNGNSDLDQTRACLERTLNPIHEQSIISYNETTSLSPGWIGGRTAGNLRRRPSFITTFRLSRSLRSVQRPHYISFYKPKEDTPEVIVTMQEVKQWLKDKKSNSLKHVQCHQTNSSCIQIKCLPSQKIVSPIPSLFVSTKDRSPFVYMSPRRAGWSPMVNR